MENRHMSELNQKSSRGLQWAKTSIFFNFLKSFRKGRKSLYSHSRTIKHTNQLIWMENGHMSELSQKSSPGLPWEKTSIFWIFWKVFENEENPHILTPGLLKYKNSLIWMENGHMSELIQKSSQGPRWAKISIFSIFWKVLENEENPHILTPRQLKYTNSLIWMENGHMSGLSQKSSPSTLGENFNFFRFFENEVKSSYCHPRTTKIFKFTHLDGKCAHEWIEP